MSNLRSVAVGLLLSGCASGTGGADTGDSGTVPTRVRGSGDTAELVLGTEEHPVAAEFDHAPGPVYAAAVQTYEDLELEITSRRPAETVGTRRLRLRRVLAGNRLSRYLSCGIHVTGRPAADRYIVFLDVTTRLAPSASGTHLETTVTATASDPGQSTGEVVCATTGRLEALIEGEIRKRLSAGA